MLRVPRRRIIRDFGLVIASMLPHNAVKHYRVDFLCHSKNQEAFDQFMEFQKGWEDVEAIKAITERYIRSGEIVKVEFEESKDRLEHRWSYIFSNRKSFTTWNSEIIFGGRFKLMKLPPVYKYKIVEKFLS